MPPILPCSMKTVEEVQRAAIYCTSNEVEWLKKNKPTARALAIYLANVQLLVERLKELENGKG